MKVVLLKNSEFVFFRVFTDFEIRFRIWLTSFLSSPIECVAFERLELLRTEIHVVVFFPHLSFLVSELFLVPMVFISTYGMYKYLWYV